MLLASTSILVFEQPPQNGYHQHLCPQGESQRPPASLEDPEIQQVGLIQASFKLLLLHCVLEHARFCMCH